MRAVLLALSCFLLISDPANACRGLWEYPQTAAQLAQADMTPAEKEAMQMKLDAGWALHKRGRAEENRKLMRESVGILDDIKARLDK